METNTFPVTPSTTEIEPSREPIARMRPSGENATQTPDRVVFNFFQVEVSHRLTVPEWVALASMLLSGENSRLSTSSEPPSRVSFKSPFMSWIRIVLSWYPPLARISALGLKARLSTKLERSLNECNLVTCPLLA